jgi:hypothetical protein
MKKQLGDKESSRVNQSISVTDTTNATVKQIASETLQAM